VDWTFAVIAGPEGGVEAGTLLGAGGPDAAAHAGDGAVARTRPGGGVEIRAARDGAPVLVDGSVVVAPTHAIEGNVDRSEGLRTVRGSLRITGRVSPGGELSATGSLRLEGGADRATLRAGGELHVEGRVTGAVLTAGAHTALRRRLHAPLRDVADELDALIAMAGQVRAAAAGQIDVARVIRVLSAERFDGLADRLDEAHALLTAAGRAWPGLCAELAAETGAAHRAIAVPELLSDPLARLSAAAGFLGAAVQARRPAMEAGVRVATAHGCSITTPGPLRLTGAGATDCDMDVGGDLTAMGRGGAIRGGSARVGGHVRARELSGRGGADLRIEITGAHGHDDLLCADVVEAGVEVIVRGQPIRFDRRCTGVRIGLGEGRPVLLAA
jgi:cytoskeletal protein CcmA (bactofilin family)